MEFLFQIIIIVVIWGCIASSWQKQKYWEEIKKPVKYDPNAPKQLHSWDIITQELYNIQFEWLRGENGITTENKTAIAYKRAKAICDKKGIYWWSSRYD